MEATFSTPRNPEKLQALIHRLRRLEGQARGVQRMLEEGRDCREILVQLAAMKAAINRIAMHLIANNMEECILSKEGEARTKQLEALASALANF